MKVSLLGDFEMFNPNIYSSIYRVGKPMLVSTDASVKFSIIRLVIGGKYFIIITIKSSKPPLSGFYTLLSAPEAAESTTVVFSLQL